MKTSVRALLSLSHTDVGDASRTRQAATLRELTAPGFTLPFHAVYIDPVDIGFSTGTVVSSDAEMFAEWERETAERARLIASAEMTIDVAKIAREHPGSEDGPSPVFQFVFAAQEMIRAIADLVIAANLARPGSLEIGVGAIVFGDSYSHPIPPANNTCHSQSKKSNNLVGR